MKILSIELFNFRQFMGKQSFSFEPVGNRNVSMIFAANGVGKTTLLNAFTWSLYGLLSDDVEEKERLITDCAWSQTILGGMIAVYVEVSFEHEGIIFKAKRIAEVAKSSGEQGHLYPKLILSKVTINGQSEVVFAPQQMIETILPQRLSRFFFFNGERIEKLAHGRAYAEVKQDIKILLGLEQVERALVHLPKVDRKLSKELKKHGGSQAAAIQGDIEVKEDHFELLKAQMLEAELSLVEFSEEREVVLERLRQHEGAGPLQTRRDSVAKLLKNEQESLKAQMDQRDYIVATKGFLAFTGNVATRANEIAADLHDKGSLPAPLKREFVDSLLERHKCICGTELTPGLLPYQEVQNWRAKAGLAEVEAAWQRLSGEVGLIHDSRGELKTSLQEKSGAISKAQSRIRELEGEKSELDSKLKDMPMEEVGKLEEKRKDLESRILEVNVKITQVRSKVKANEVELASLRSQLKQAKVGDELAIIASRRMQVVQHVQAALTEILEIRSQEMRKRLDEKVKEVFSEITIKPYIPYLHDDFELGLFAKSPTGQDLPVPKGTGENQILSLSFVAAVSQLAREVQVERQGDDESQEDWGTYPLVMDAAFGSLDLNYQRTVSRALARIAPQMVVLVSRSQGQGQVFSELRPHLASLGIIVSHSTNISQPSESIEINGYNHAYIHTGAEMDWSELVEVKI